MKIKFTISIVIAIFLGSSCDKEKVSEDPTITRGRELFNDIKFDNFDNHTLSCGTCHPGGDMDNLKWKLRGFADSLSTPTLFGVTETPAYGWFGDRGSDIRGFTKYVIDSLLLGSADSLELDALTAYVQSLVVPANPWRNTDGSLTEAQARGKIVYENQGKCVNCHSGEVSTAKFKIQTRVGKPQVDIPSLRWDFATGPYFYDNSKATLRDVIDFYADSVTTGQMTTWGWNGLGINSKIDLTQQERNDLFEYLRSL